MKEIIFDYLKSEYIAQICEIEQEAFLSPWSEQSFKGELHNTAAHYIVAIDNETGKIAGYGGFWKILEEGYITNIAVSKAYRGKGIGKGVLEKMTELAKKLEIERMTLEVRKSNETAIGLYQKYGFVTLGERPKYYENGETALIMWMEVANED